MSIKNICEDVVRNRTMNKVVEDVVVLSSDEEECKDGPSTAAKTKQPQRKRGQPNRSALHGNQLEHSDMLSVSVMQEMKSRKQLATERKLRGFQQLRINDPGEPEVFYVPDDREEEVTLIQPIQDICHDIKFGSSLESPTEFPYELLKKLEDHLVSSIGKLSYPSESAIWECVLEELTVIRYMFEKQLDLRTDARFNMIVSRIFAKYISFRAHQAAANKKLGQTQVDDLCLDIWKQMGSLVGENYSQRILILLRTDPTDYKLCVVLHPLFEWTHQEILRYQPQTLPQILVIILVVLFYKHFLLMCTEEEDRRKHMAMAMSSLRMFGRMPRPVDKKYNLIIRNVDDRIHHAYLGNRTICHLFRTKIDITNAIPKFFLRYDALVLAEAQGNLPNGRPTTSNNFSPNNDRRPPNPPPNNIRQQNHQRQQRQQQLQQRRGQNEAGLSTSSPFNRNSCSSNSFNNNNNVRDSFKVATTTNDTGKIANLDDSDDDDDDIVFIDETKSSRNNSSQSFDENANLSANASSLVQSQSDQSRLKSTEPKGNLLFSSSQFSDSKPESSSSSFHQHLGDSISDSDVAIDETPTINASLPSASNQSEKHSASTAPNDETISLDSNNSVDMILRQAVIEFESKKQSTPISTPVSVDKSDKPSQKVHDGQSESSMAQRLNMSLRRSSALATATARSATPLGINQLAHVKTNLSSSTHVKAKACDSIDICDQMQSPLDTIKSNYSTCESPPIFALSEESAAPQPSSPLVKNTHLDSRETDQLQSQIKSIRLTDSPSVEKQTPQRRSNRGSVVDTSSISSTENNVTMPTYDNTRKLRSTSLYIEQGYRRNQQQQSIEAPKTDDSVLQPVDTVLDARSKIDNESKVDDAAVVQQVASDVQSVDGSKVMMDTSDDLPELLDEEIPMKATDTIISETEKLTISSHTDSTVDKPAMVDNEAEPAEKVNNTEPMEVTESVDTDKTEQEQQQPSTSTKGSTVTKPGVEIKTHASQFCVKNGISQRMSQRRHSLNNLLTSESQNFLDGLFCGNASTKQSTEHRINGTKQINERRVTIASGGNKSFSNEQTRYIGPFVTRSPSICEERLRAPVDKTFITEKLTEIPLPPSTTEQTDQESQQTSTIEIKSSDSEPIAIAPPAEDDQKDIAKHDVTEADQSHETKEPIPDASEKQQDEPATNVDEVPTLQESKAIDIAIDSPVQAESEISAATEALECATQQLESIEEAEMSDVPKDKPELTYMEMEVNKLIHDTDIITKKVNALSSAEDIITKATASPRRRSKRLSRSKEKREAAASETPTKPSPIVEQTIVEEKSERKSIDEHQTIDEVDKVCDDQAEQILTVSEEPKSTDLPPSEPIVEKPPRNDMVKDNLEPLLLDTEIINSPEAFDSMEQTPTTTDIENKSDEVKTDETVSDESMKPEYQRETPIAIEETVAEIDSTEQKHETATQEKSKTSGEIKMDQSEDVAEVPKSEDDTVELIETDESMEDLEICDSSSSKIADKEISIIVKIGDRQGTGKSNSDESQEIAVIVLNDDVNDDVNDDENEDDQMSGSENYSIYSVYTPERVNENDEEIDVIEMPESSAELSAQADGEATIDREDTEVSVIIPNDQNNILPASPQPTIDETKSTEVVESVEEKEPIESVEPIRFDTDQTERTQIKPIPIENVQTEPIQTESIQSPIQIETNDQVEEQQTEPSVESLESIELTEKIKPIEATEITKNTEISNEKVDEKQIEASFERIESNKPVELNEQIEKIEPSVLPETIKHPEPIIEPMEEQLIEPVIEPIEEKQTKPTVETIEEKSVEQSVQPIEEVRIDENQTEPTMETIEEKSVEQSVQPIEEVRIEEQQTEPTMETIEEKSVEQTVTPIEEVRIDEKQTESTMETIEEKSVEQSVQPIEEVQIEEKQTEPTMETIEEKPVDRTMQPIEDEQIEEKSTEPTMEILEEKQTEPMMEKIEEKPVESTAELTEEKPTELAIERSESSEPIESNEQIEEIELPEIKEAVKQIEPAIESPKVSNERTLVASPPSTMQVDELDEMEEAAKEIEQIFLEEPQPESMDDGSQSVDAGVQAITSQTASIRLESDSELTQVDVDENEKKLLEISSDQPTISPKEVEKSSSKSKSRSKSKKESKEKSSSRSKSKSKSKSKSRSSKSEEEIVDSTAPLDYTVKSSKAEVEIAEGPAAIQTIDGPTQPIKESEMLPINELEAEPKATPIEPKVDDVSSISIESQYDKPSTVAEPVQEQPNEAEQQPEIEEQPTISAVPASTIVVPNAAPVAVITSPHPPSIQPQFECNQPAVLPIVPLKSIESKSIEDLSQGFFYPHIVNSQQLTPLNFSKSNEQSVVQEPTIKSITPVPIESLTMPTTMASIATDTEPKSSLPTTEREPNMPVSVIMPNPEVASIDVSPMNLSAEQKESGRNSGKRKVAKPNKVVKSLSATNLDLLAEAAQILSTQFAEKILDSIPGGKSIVLKSIEPIDGSQSTKSLIDVTTAPIIESESLPPVIDEQQPSTSGVATSKTEEQPPNTSDVATPKTEQPARKSRSAKAEKQNTVSVRKSTRVLPARQAKEPAAEKICEEPQKERRTSKRGKKSQEVEEEIIVTLDKLKKMTTENKKETIIRATDTITEISPFKVQTPAEAPQKKTNETYEQKLLCAEPEYESHRQKYKKKPEKLKEKEKEREKSKRDRSRSLRDRSQTKMSYNESEDVQSAGETSNEHEFLAALELVEREKALKRSHSHVESTSLKDQEENASTPGPSIRKSKRKKLHHSQSMDNVLSDKSHRSNVKDVCTPEPRPKYDSTPCSMDSTLTSAKSFPFSTSPKEPQSGDRYASNPLGMKKMFECQCTLDRNKMKKRLKEFNVKIPSQGDDDVSKLISETIPNDYMETLTTLIIIKKIFYQRFAALLPTDIPHLDELQARLRDLPQIMPIDNKIFDGVDDSYKSMKEYKEGNGTNPPNVPGKDLWKCFGRFLRWWSRQFKRFCTPNKSHKNKSSRKSYDTEESISSDSNSQERYYSLARESPRKIRRIDDESQITTPTKTVPEQPPPILLDSNVPLPPMAVDTQQQQHHPTPIVAVVPTPEQPPPLLPPPSPKTPDLDIPTTSATIAPITSTPTTSPMPPVPASATPSSTDPQFNLPIDPANTVISLPNNLYESADIEITKNPSPTRFGSDDSFPKLEINSNEHGLDDQYFSDEISVMCDIPLDPVPETKNHPPITIPETTYDNYRPRYDCTDPTMGGTGLLVSTGPDQPMSIEDALYTLTDNNMTLINNLPMSHIHRPHIHQCVAPKEILNPLRDKKKDSDSTGNRTSEPQPQPPQPSQTPNKYSDGYWNSDSDTMNDSGTLDFYEILESGNDMEFVLYEPLYQDNIKSNPIAYKVIQNENIPCNNNDNGESFDSKNQKTPTKRSIKDVGLNEPVENSPNNDVPVETPNAAKAESAADTELNDSSMGYAQLKMPYEDIYDAVPTRELDLNGELDPEFKLLPTIESMDEEQPVPKVEEFTFKQPLPHTNGSSSRTHSSSRHHSSDSHKNHKSKRKNMEVAGDEAPAKFYKSSSRKGGPPSSTGDYPNTIHVFELLPTKSVQNESQNVDNNEIQEVPTPTLYIKLTNSVYPSSKHKSSRKSSSKSMGKSSSKSSKSSKHHHHRSENHHKNRGHSHQHHSSNSEKLSNGEREPIIKIKIKNIPPPDDRKKCYSFGLSNRDEEKRENDARLRPVL